MVNSNDNDNDNDNEQFIWTYQSAIVVIYILLIFYTVMVQEITLGHKISLVCNYPSKTKFDDNCFIYRKNR